MINKIITDAKKSIASAIDLKALEDSRVLFLGKKGELTDLLKALIVFGILSGIIWNDVFGVIAGIGVLMGNIGDLSLIHI